MANYTRTDNSPIASDAATRQRPIVLARLPRIGAPTAAPVATLATAPPSSSSPRTPQPERMPRLELRTELDQRIKLHIADTADDPTASPNVYFADSEHALASGAESIEVQAVPESLRSRTRTASPTSPNTRPATISEKLFQLHNQLSPHAGLIVALALIASAGLLYWMMTGPAQLSTPQYENFGRESQSEGLGSRSHQMPEDYVPQFTAELPQAERSPDASEQWNKVTLPAPGELAEPTLLPPLEPAPTEPENAVKQDQSHYPKTLAAEPLDFTKVMTHTGSPLSDGSHMLPEVARRPAESTTR